MNLRVRARLVREEHHAELADDGIEAPVFKRKFQRIGELPLHRPLRADRGRSLEHWRIQVGGDDRRCVGQVCGEMPRQHAGAGGNFQHPRGKGTSRPSGQISCITLEDQRHQLPVIDFRYGVDKCPIALVSSHGGLRAQSAVGVLRIGRSRRSICEIGARLQTVGTRAPSVPP